MQPSAIDQVVQRLPLAGRPLLFICVLPHWADNEGIASMLGSSHLLAHTLLPKAHHRYRSGLQHIAQDKNLQSMYEGATLLLWLGTSAVPEQWRPTEDVIEEQRRLWLPDGQV